MIQKRCLTDAPLTDYRSGFVCGREQAVRDLTQVRLAPVKAGRVFDGVAEGERVHGDSVCQIMVIDL